MTPAEFVDKEIAEMELTRTEASLTMGYNRGWLTMMMNRKTFDSCVALAIVTDLWRIKNKKVPINAYKRLASKRKSANLSAHAKKRWEEHRNQGITEPLFWY